MCNRSVNYLDTFNLMYTLDNVLLERATHINYLGVKVDEPLNWKLHLEHVANKLYKAIGILYKLRHSFTKT